MDDGRVNRKGRLPVQLTGLVAIALTVIAAMTLFTATGASPEATPAGGVPEREVEELPTADATIRLTLLGCEDGVDPQVTPDQCTTPIDIPVTARVMHRHGLLDVAIAVSNLPLQQRVSQESLVVPPAAPIGGGCPAQHQT